LSGYTIIATIGRPLLTPVGGTFTLTFDGDTTDPIPYDSTATDIANELNGLASITTAGGVMVTGHGSGLFVIAFLTDGAQGAMTTDADALIPESRAIITVHITGDVDTAEVKYLRLFQEPAAYASLSHDTVPDTDPMAEAEVIVAGGSGVNMEFRVSFYQYVYGGTWSILWDTGDVEVIIPFGATAEEVKAAIEEIITPETASVVKEEDGSYLITIEDGTDHTATLSVGLADLQVIRHYIGELALTSLGLELLTVGGDAELYFEIEAFASGDEPEKIYRQAITVGNPIADYRYTP
jgi:hypothetical protein